MLLEFPRASTFDRYHERRQRLVHDVKELIPHGADALIVIVGNFESHVAFRQESSFYYLTGITEPGMVLTLDMCGRSMLYMPHFGNERAKWSIVAEPIATRDAQTLCVTQVKELGDLCGGYQIQPFFTVEIGRAHV